MWESCFDKLEAVKRRNCGKVVRQAFPVDHAASEKVTFRVVIFTCSCLMGSLSSFVVNFRELNFMNLLVYGVSCSRHIV